MKKLLGFLVIIFSLWSGSFCEAATLRINAPKIELELSCGETYSGEIVVENPTEDEVKLKAYLEDWRYKGTGSGEKDFSPPGSAVSSASPWITFSPAEDVLKPFGRTVVRYSVSVPAADLGGAYYSVLFFETVLGNIQNEEGANVLVSGRIGALFIIHIKGTVQRSGRLEAVDITAPKGNSPMEIKTRFRNTGNAEIALGGNFIVMDASGKVAARGDLNKLYTQGGQSGESKTEWIGRLEKGVYEAILTYDLGKGQTMVEEKSLAVE